MIVNVTELNQHGYCLKDRGKHWRANVIGFFFFFQPIVKCVCPLLCKETGAWAQGSTSGQEEFLLLL